MMVLVKNTIYKNKKLIILLLIVLEFFLIFLSFKSYGNKNLDKYVFGVDTEINKNMMSILMEDDLDKYIATDLEKLPGLPYVYNSRFSSCVDSEGNKIENSLSYDDYNSKVTINVNQTSMCYFYFRKPKEVASSLVNDLISAGELWSSGLEGDGYRFVGRGSYNSDTSPSNFICFGTTDKDECTSDTEKYLYRIIGVFPDEFGVYHLKLIKFKQLGSFAYNDTATSDVLWENSSIYSKLMGTYFMNNTSKYDYLTVGTDWYYKIADWKFINSLTKTSSDSGPNYGNSLTPIEIYLHEMNRNSNTYSIGEWSTFYAKIGLMYVSDYMLSLGNDALNMSGGSVTNEAALKTGWIHQYNNDHTKSDTDWTMTRRGVMSGTYYAWAVHSTGEMAFRSIDSPRGIRPVFYLTSNTLIHTGTGEFGNPYIVGTGYGSSLGVGATLNENVVTATITRGDYDLYKYCLSMSANYFEGCTWKDITSNQITESLTTEGTYFIHVLDREGFIAHSAPIGYVLRRGLQKIGDYYYYYDNSGVLQTGWQEIDGKKYYFSPTAVDDAGVGAAATKWLQLDGYWYYFDANGVMQTGWVKPSNIWYFLGPDGKMLTGWIEDGGEIYYTNSDGAMLTGWQQIEGYWYYFNASGAMVTGWFQDTDGLWYYLKPEGFTAWSGPVGSMLASTTATISGKSYTFNSSGACTNK